MESRVVPAMGVTMLRSTPVRALIIDDLPTLGRPTTAMRGRSEVSSSLGFMSFTSSSSSSPVPEPFIPEIGYISPKPRA